MRAGGGRADEARGDRADQAGSDRDGSEAGASAPGAGGTRGTGTDQPDGAAEHDDGPTDSDPVSLLRSDGERRRQFVDELYRALERKRALERDRRVG